MIPKPTFTDSRLKEVNRLLDRDIYELVDISEVPNRVRIFGSRFVNKIKFKGTTDAYKKSRIIVQAYNNKDKEKILCQSPLIQRVSQRVILALTLSLIKAGKASIVYLRDITQVYTQSKDKIKRLFYIWLPKSLNLPSGLV